MRSAVAPKSGVCATTDSWSMTAASTSSPTRTAAPRERITGPAPPARASLARDLRTLAASGGRQDLYEVHALELGEWFDVQRLVNVELRAIDLLHAPDGDAPREERRQPAGRREARGHHGLAGLDLAPLLDEVEQQVVGVADLGTDDPVGALGHHLGRHRAALVGDQAHGRRAAGGRGDLAGEAVARDHRLVDVDAVVRALVDLHAR